MIDASQLAVLKHSIERETVADVLVVGGGTAGFVAAIASARTGAQTILVEYMPFLGGTHGGGGTVIGGTGFYHTYVGPDRREKFRGPGKEEAVVRGLAHEYMNRMIASGAAYGEIDHPPTFIANDVELTKVVIEEMVTESGVDLWLMTQLVEVVVEDGKVTGALVTRGGGLSFISTNVIIDASGDGEAGYRAGAEHDRGRESDGVPQPSTMMFDMGGVDLFSLLKHLNDNPSHLSNREGGDGLTAVGRLEANLREQKPFTLAVNCGHDEAIANGDIPTSLDSDTPILRLGSMYTFWRSGKVVPTITSHNFDMVHGLDATDRDDLDRASVKVKSIILDIVEYYKKYIPGFENAFLLRFAPMLGVRESRRIVGDYIITEDDALNATDFSDSIARCGAYIDVHGEEPGQEVDFREVGGERGWYQIPYRSLVAKGVDGILLAGRLISTDHIVQGSTRNQVVCMATGHAAGVAAALAVKDGVSPRLLDVEVLQATLREQEVLV